MSGKDGLALPEGWKPNPEWFYDPNPRKPAAPVESEPGQPGKSGGYRSGLTAARGSDVTPAAPPAVPVVQPEPGDRAAIVDNLRKIARLQEPGYGLLAGEIEAATLAADMLEADAAAVAAVRADTAAKIEALDDTGGCSCETCVTRRIELGRAARLVRGES